MQSLLLALFSLAPRECFEGTLQAPIRAALPMSTMIAEMQRSAIFINFFLSYAA
jgi:hypothetical protein